MVNDKDFKPADSYRLKLPGRMRERYENGVTSVWIPHEPLLLQLSSLIRHDMTQADAMERLSSRVGKNRDKRWNLTHRRCTELNVDQACGSYIDDDGVYWLHTYLVWPHLTIYATISGPEEVVRGPKNWAASALNSIELIHH